jgi:ABC-type transport system substrate-binding protein
MTAAPSVLRYGLAQIPLGLDPHIFSAPELSILLNNVYETLVYLNEDYQYEPSLAESWHVSANGLSFTFKLRSSIYFHDDTRFNAQAVKENLDRIVESPTGSRKAASLLRGYQGSDVLDPYTIRVRFAEPYPDFLDSLAQVYLSIASPTAFKKWGPTEYQKHLTGTGPFRFSAEDYVPGDTVVLERNPDYSWGFASYRNRGPKYFGSGHNPNSSCQQTHQVHDHSGPAFLDRVIFKSIADPDERVAALEVGLVDAVDQLPLQYAAGWAEAGQYWITPEPVGLFHARGETNKLRLNQPDLDRFIDQAENTMNQDERVRLYRLVRRMAIDQAFRNPLGDFIHFSAASLEVNCLTYDIHGWSPFLYEVELKSTNGKAGAP